MVKLTFKHSRYDDVGEISRESIPESWRLTPSSFFQCLANYDRLLSYVKNVTRNYAEKSINNILDHVSNSQDMGFLEKFYATTLESLQEQKNDVGRILCLEQRIQECLNPGLFFFVSCSAFVDQNQPQIGQTLVG